MRPHSYHSIHSRIYHYCKQAASSFGSEYGWYAIGYSVGALWGAHTAHNHPSYPAWGIGLTGFIAAVASGVIWWGARAIYNYHKRPNANNNKVTTRKGRPNTIPHPSNTHTVNDNHSRANLKLIYRRPRVFDYDRNK